MKVYNHRSVNIQQKESSLLRKLVTFITTMDTEKIFPVVYCRQNSVLTWNPGINCQTNLKRVGLRISENSQY